MTGHAIELAPGEQLRAFSHGWLLIVDLVGRMYRVADAVTREVAASGKLSGDVALEGGELVLGRGEDTRRIALPPSNLAARTRFQLPPFAQQSYTSGALVGKRAVLPFAGGRLHCDSLGSTWLELDDEWIRAELLRVFVDSTTGWIAADYWGGRICLLPGGCVPPLAAQLRSVAAALRATLRPVGAASLSGAGISVVPRPVSGSGSGGLDVTGGGLVGPPGDGLEAEARRVFLGWNEDSLVIAGADGAKWHGAGPPREVELGGGQPVGVALDRSAAIARCADGLRIGGPAEQSWGLPPLVGFCGCCWSLSSRLFVVDTGRCGEPRVWTRLGGSERWWWIEGTPVALGVSGESLLSSARGRLLRTHLTTHETVCLGMVSDHPVSVGAALEGPDLLVFDPLGGQRIRVGDGYRLLPAPIEIKILRGSEPPPIQGLSRHLTRAQRGRSDARVLRRRAS